MEEEKVRIRLVFEDRRILSKYQKKQGLTRSWVVLNRKCHRTVSEFSNHLFRTFSLCEACPHGLTLSMDGFVLPPFESSCVLKDKDIVCVKKKKGSLLEIVGEDSEDNVDNAIEVEERPQIRPGEMLLANEEFQKETGGYESESEEDEVEEEAEEFVPEKKTSKKRKASSKSLSSKRKKCKLATTEESPEERENIAVVSNVVKKKKKRSSDVQRAENDEQDNGNTKPMANSKRLLQEEESKEPNDLCQLSAETKKTPSRSARRKKAKRQWLREKTKLEKEELQQKQLVVAPSQKPVITIDYQATEENHCEALESQQPDELSDGVGDEVVPVEVRPGHIRFKPLAGTDEAPLESEPPAEKFLWNGNMTKKKGQKWGTEKTGFSKRYAQDFNEDTTYQTKPAEAETLAMGPIDYERLVAYTGSIKKGDVIAYRLIELTSSWTPEVSSFRVGKISYYDPDSKKVTLMPVQEFPIEKKTEEDDDFSMEPDTSLYKEDGSLEIEFSALLDVRSVKTSSSDSAEVAKSAPPEPDQSATKLKLSANKDLQTPIKVNPWEELSEALSAKKAELSQANNGWNKKGSSSGGGSWSYKALRGSAMGPVMNYLRSQKEI
ncbi:Coilin N-terminal domain [Arabidopsis thaliana x Arabidopsis arenosa]|uniref:Coilin N-terminal domain n=1 Tax=Arabidopsis thaliana x Arabidopsis arenosa TaxID=1240361 RepID=A0A8T2C0Q3_9BRAS|nr:Coilin N-terminal domain [Arabidopsis thaliana x Arabidopsis arenosa]